LINTGENLLARRWKLNRRDTVYGSSVAADYSHLAAERKP